MQSDPSTSPIEHITELAHEIIEECPSCAARASEILVWASEIRERRPSREELAAVVDATCRGALSSGQRDILISELRALVRFAG